MEGREGSEGQNHKEEESERGSGMERTYSYGGRTVLGYLCRSLRVSIVTSLLMGLRSAYLARASLKSQSAPVRYV